MKLCLLLLLGLQLLLAAVVYGQEEGYYYGEEETAEEEGYYYGEEEAGPVPDRDYDYGDERYDYGEEGAIPDYGDGRYDYGEEGAYDGDYYRTDPYYNNRNRNLFGIYQSDIDYMVESYDHDGETRYTFGEGFDEAIQEKMIPELCYLTSKNYTLYNSYLLDDFLLEQLEKMSPECQSFKCDVLHYAHEHGARIFVDLMNATSINDVTEIVGAELSRGFEELNFCTCGREFFRAIFKSAPFYNANALVNMMDGYGYVGVYQKYMRRLDIKSAGKVFDQLMAGVCASGSEGMCLNDIVDVFGELAKMYNTTAQDYGNWDNADTRKLQRKEEKRCDAFFGLVNAWGKAGDYRYDDLSPMDGELFWNTLFLKLGAASNAVYCNTKCRKEVTRLYPCCLRKMLENDKIWDNVVNFVDSFHLLYPVMDGRYDLQYFHEEDMFEEWASWTVPEELRETFMRFVHAAKYCEGKNPKCY